LGEDGDIVAVRQGNVFGTSFHPELTGDERIHAWWLGEVVKAVGLAEQSS
jgi:5'-phosphate synthase pdxT subunit